MCCYLIRRKYVVETETGSVHLKNCSLQSVKARGKNCLKSAGFRGWRWKVTQMLAGSGSPAVTPETGLVSKRTQLTGRQYQWADLSAAHASRYFSNCVFFLLFVTLPQFIPAVISVVALLVVRLVSGKMLYIQVGMYTVLHLTKTEHWYYLSIWYTIYLLKIEVKKIHINWKLKGQQWLD